MTNLVEKTALALWNDGHGPGTIEHCRDLAALALIAVKAELPQVATEIDAALAEYDASDKPQKGAEQ